MHKKEHFLAVRSTGILATRACNTIKRLMVSDHEGESRWQAEKSLIIFAGPPCSSKSTLATLLSERTGWAHLEMDDIRARLMPDSSHAKADRAVAYRSLNYTAELLLKKHQSVIVDASNAPRRQRQDLAEIAYRTRATAFLFECRISEDLAVQRFSERLARGHPGRDLTPERVRLLVEGFSYSHLGLELDSSQSAASLLIQIEAAISERKYCDMAKWSQTGNMDGATADAISKPEDRLSEGTRTRARWSLRGYRLAISFPAILLIGGFLILLVKPLGIAFTDIKWRELREWGLFLMGAAIVLAAVFATADHFLARIQRAQTVVRAGKVPRYDPADETPTPDAELYSAYRSRSITDSLDGFRVPDVPLFFVVIPEQGKSFDVLLEEGGIDCHFTDTYLIRRAAEMGLDWLGFKRWRIAKKDEEYFLARHELVGRCASMQRGEGTVRLTCAPCDFHDHQCTDRAVQVTAQGRLPDMRELLEGPAWRNSKLDLRDIVTAARTYSLSISTCTLVLSADNCVILTRRSNRVLSGAGWLAASASGFAKWKSDFQRQYISDGVSLRFAAVRELEEEIGLSEFDLYPEPRPFLGAAFNLRYGRDLNFYACFRTKCRIDEVSEKLKDAKDAWELSSLVPVPVSAIKDDGTLTGQFEAFTLECNRHLRGALLSLAVSGRLAEWQQLIQVR